MAKKLEWYIEKYGEKEGNKRHKDIRLKIGRASAGRNTKAGFIKRYGKLEGIKRFNAFTQKSKKTLHTYVVKYGPVDGPTKYKRYVDNKTRNFTSRERYWVDRGYTIKQARSMVRQAQSKTGIASFIERYGETEGTEKYVNNNNKQAYALSLAGFIERYGIESGEQRFRKYCADRAVTKSNQIKKYGYQDGTKRWNSIVQRKRELASRLNGYNVSVESLKVLKSIYKYARNSGIERTDIMWGIEGSTEMFLVYDGGMYFYDFCIAPLNIIIEYNGVHVHPKPTTCIHEQQAWMHVYSREDYHTRLSIDQHKQSVAEDNQFTVFHLWSDEDNIDTIHTIKGMIDDLVKK